MLRSAALLPAVVLLLVGAIFTGQGLGYIKGSFMTGSHLWLGIGIVMVVVALVVLAWARPGARRRG